MYNYSLALPIPLGLTLRGKEPRGDRKAWLPDKEGGLLSTWLHTSLKSPPSWISIWPLSGQNAVFAGEPRSCAPPLPHSAVSQQWACREPTGD